MVRLLIDYCNCTLEIYIIVPASRKHSSKLICCDALNTGEIISTVSPNLTRDIYIYRRRTLVTTLFFLAVLIKSRKEEKIKNKKEKERKRETFKIISFLLSSSLFGKIERDIRFTDTFHEI